MQIQTNMNTNQYERKYRFKKGKGGNFFSVCNYELELLIIGNNERKRRKANTICGQRQTSAICKQTKVFIFKALD